MYYIIENQIKEDGTVNTTTTARSTFALGLSYYYERCSKMVATDLFPKVGILFCDAELNVLEHNIIETQYTASATE